MSIHGHLLNMLKNNDGTVDTASYNSVELEVNMDILYSSSDKYAKYTGISILSLYENNRNVTDISVSVISTDITEQNKRILEDITAEYGRKITFIDAIPVFANAREEYGLTDFRGSMNTFGRLFIDKWVPDIERVIFIDSDTIVNGSLEELYAINMKDNIMGGVYEIGVYIKGVCVEDPNLVDQCDPYINCGVILFNVKRWKELNGAELIKKGIKEYGKPFRIVDESILNYSFRDYCMKIPLKYNLTTYAHCADYKDILRRYKKTIMFSENEYKEAILNPIIIHYMGDYYLRPWFKKNVSKYCKEYFTYYYISPWKDTPLEDIPSNISLPFKCYYAFLIFLKKHNMNELYFRFRYIFIQWAKTRCEGLLTK